MAGEGGLLQEFVGLAGGDVHTFFLIFVEVLSLFTGRHRGTFLLCFHQVEALVTFGDLLALL